MADEKPKSRFRFGIRAMLCVITLVALSLGIGPQVYDWYYSVPLADAVWDFNLHAVRYGSALTEQEVISAIESQLPEFSGDTQDVLKRILRTHRLPQNASLNATEYQDGWKSKRLQRIDFDIFDYPDGEDMWSQIRLR